MAKQSTTQIYVRTVGDYADTNIGSAPLVNAAAPSAGPVQYTLVAGVPLSITPPVGTVGILISPGTVADTLQVGGIFGGANMYLRSDRSHFFAPDLVAQASYEFYSAAGGTIFIQWT